MEIITVTGRSAAVLNPLPCHLAVMVTSYKFSPWQIIKLSIWWTYVTHCEGTVGAYTLVWETDMIKSVFYFGPDLNCSNWITSYVNKIKQRYYATVIKKCIHLWIIKSTLSKTKLLHITNFYCTTVHHLISSLLDGDRCFVLNVTPVELSQRSKIMS